MLCGNAFAGQIKTYENTTFDFNRSKTGGDTTATTNAEIINAIEYCKVILCSIGRARQEIAE